MRLLLATCMFCMLSLYAPAQTNPVRWEFSAKKIDATHYEVHCTAYVAAPWHIYSQTTPDGGPVATQITFNKNPLLLFPGAPTEKGILVTKYEEVFSIDVKYFNGIVTFVQPVTVKAKAKTNVSGTISYMVCNDSQCLPPAKVPFTVTLP